MKKFMSRDPRTHAFSLIAGYFTWQQAAGVSFVLSVTAFFVVTFTGVLGLGALKFLLPNLETKEDYAFWIAGPCLGIGALLLLCLRVVVSKEVFIFLFFTIPVLFFIKWFGVRRAMPRPPSVLDREKLLIVEYLLLTGLIGIGLQRYWIMASAVSIIAISLGIFLAVANSQTLKSAWLFLVPLFLTIFFLAIWRLRGSLPSTWWMDAEQIPADESYLEALSNGLLEFGPLVNPVYSSLNGAGAAAYHHLAYLLIGIINYLASPQAYLTQILIVPVVFTISILANLILFLKRYLLTPNSNSDLGIMHLLGVAACLSALRLGSHPSHFLGVSAIASSLVLVGVAISNDSNWRSSILVGVSMWVVAFSKGPWVIAPLAISSVCVLGNLRSRWRVGVVSITSFLLITTFFSTASSEATALRFQFWASSNMTSAFDFSIYNLKVFTFKLVLPVGLGLMTAVVLLIFRCAHLQHFALSLTVVIVGGILSQILLTSDYEDAYSGFFRPASIAAAILLLLLAIVTASVYDSNKPRFLLAFTGFGVIYWVLSRTSLPGISQPGAPLVFTTGLWGIGILLTMCLKSLKGEPPSIKVTRKWLAILGTLLLLFSAVTVTSGYLERVKGLESVNKNRDSRNWLGDSQMREMVDFLRQQTSNSDLIAVSICPPSDFVGDKCEPDFRLAALSGRRFLALDPWGNEEAIERPTWPDIVYSGQIGSLSPSEVVEGLRSRGASYLVIDRQRVSKRWDTSLGLSNFLPQFENPRYLVLKTPVDKASHTKAGGD
jgi:hypothetical protein